MGGSEVKPRNLKTECVIMRCLVDGGVWNNGGVMNSLGDLKKFGEEHILVQLHSPCISHEIPGD
jgi:hypothetical protein